MLRVYVAIACLAGCHKELDDAFRATPIAGLEVKTCAAYPYEPEKTRAFVMDANGSPGDIVTYLDSRYNIHTNDCLRFAGADLVDVRWHPDAGSYFVGLRLADEPAGRLSTRSERRMSQHDAFFIAGKLHMISLYQQVLADTLWISGPEQNMRALFSQLAGVQAPP